MEQYWRHTYTNGKGRGIETFTPRDHPRTSSATSCDGLFQFRTLASLSLRSIREPHLQSTVYFCAWNARVTDGLAVDRGIPPPDGVSRVPGDDHRPVGQVRRVGRLPLPAVRFDPRRSLRPLISAGPSLPCHAHFTAARLTIQQPPQASLIAESLCCSMTCVRFGFPPRAPEVQRLGADRWRIVRV